VILADTSAWVEHDRATGSHVDERMVALVSSPGLLAVTEPVVMEVLAGARTDEREQQLRELLGRHEMRPLRPEFDFEAAAGIYRRCRRAGITPRGLVDCLIAAVARRDDLELLANDLDLARVARVVGIRMDPASLSD
jgi:hypothetical protein